MTNPGIIFRLVTLVLQAVLVVGLFSAGWMIYQRLPAQVASPAEVRASDDTEIELVMRAGPQMAGVALSVPVEFSPVDIVAVRNEYFTERRAGKPFPDFVTERSKGRRPVTARLDENGRAQVAISPGNWWVHATLAGEVDLEWRLPVSIAGPKQTIELTPQNAYTRTKSF